MHTGLGRRLVPLSTVAIGCIPIGIVFAIALFAFGVYVNHVRQDTLALASIAVQKVDADPHLDAVAAAHELAGALVDSDLMLVFVDGTSRVTVFHDSDTAPPARAYVLVRPRADLSGTPTLDGNLSSPILGLAAIFGLQTVRARAGQIDVSAQANPRVFLANAFGFLPAFAGALIVTIVLAFAVSRVLTREALRPLNDVTRALQRFSAGDFTPEFISAERDQQLGALALAYNGAVEQVERALTERAHAAATARQFIADAGHQFRTPLTVMRGFIAILRKECDGDDTDRLHILRSMERQAMLMSALVDKLVLLERWEHDDPSARAVPTDIAKLVNDITEPFALANPERSIVATVTPDAYALLQSLDLEHAISNALDNAVKYTEGPILLTVSKTASEVIVGIADCGPGMTSGQSARAFDRFYRGNRRDVEGTGLGLAIAKRAIERAGGSIRLDSDTLLGTTLAFHLPRCAVPIAEPIPSDRY